MNNLFILHHQKSILIILSAFLITFLSASTQHESLVQSQSDFKTTVYKTEIVHSQNVKVITQESLTEQIFKKDNPAVVTIIGTIPITQNLTNPSFTDSKVTKNIRTVGSGFIISPNGTILTNKHIVNSPVEEYQVVTADDTKYDIKHMYLDPNKDIAILMIDPKDHPENSLQSLTIGDSTQVQVGQFVVAIGTAQGELRNTVTTGIVSGLNRTIEADNPESGTPESLSNLIQTSAAINPGNSGGPLINEEGQVVGITTAASVEGQNIGFALPINLVKKTLADYQTQIHKSHAAMLQ